MYGGIELVVYNLVETLTAMGEEVYLFAPPESKVSCKLVPLPKESLRLTLDIPMEERSNIFEEFAKFAYLEAERLGADIIHDHTLTIPHGKVPVLHTLHGPPCEFLVNKAVEISDYPNNFINAISNRQKDTYSEANPNINFVDTVYNSIDVKNTEWTDKKENSFLFVGRANYEKAPELAVMVAAAAGENLVMAIKMNEDLEKEYFEKKVKPLIDKYPKHLSLKLYEEIDRTLLNQLFLHAKCTLFPSRWEEPFGLVMPESMACGTPVIALNYGAAPEVIVNGKTGFVVDTEEQMIKAAKKIGQIKSKDCRRYVEENFSPEKMTKEYLAIYKKIAA